MNPLDFLRDRHGMNMTDNQLQDIVNTCAEIIVIQDQQDYEDNMRKAIDESGGCSACGDLTGFDCICENDDDDDDDACGKCGTTESQWLFMGVCEDCHKAYLKDFI